AFDLGISLDFWNWLDGFRYIGRFHALLDTVFAEYAEVHSRVVPYESFNAVLEGYVHPQSAVRAAKGKGRYWAIDLDDFEHERRTAAEYEAEHGAWFLRTQKAMQDHEYGQIPEGLRIAVPFAFPLLGSGRKEKYPTRINLLPADARG